MNRDDFLHRATSRSQPFDVLIIGGGASGAGVAVDAASRGYDTILLERADFGSGTSSRSTKLVHGGVRYLRQGDIGLVMEALHERGRLRQNAPHLVSDLRFIVPTYDWWEGPFYGVGLRIYDLLAGRYGFGPSRNLSREETIELLPNVSREGLRGGVQYYDGQFDDARLLINLIQTAADHGAVVLNYAPVVSLLHDRADQVSGAVVRDTETQDEFEIRARVVINATGPYSDAVRKMDDPVAPGVMVPSQGTHIVLPSRFLAGDSAIMVPHTSDDRVLFAIPWHGHVVVGTTDTPLDSAPFEPKPLDEEIDFILENAGMYLENDPSRADVLSAWSGIRPLVRNSRDEDTSGDTASLSRDFVVQISRSGLVSLSGGKWTTYRRMAEECVDQAAVVGELPDLKCVTRDLKIRGSENSERRTSNIEHPGEEEILRAARDEMARTVEDVLARRTRLLFLDAQKAIDAAPRTAEVLARELGRDDGWRDEQIRAFTARTESYLVG